MQFVKTVVAPAPLNFGLKKRYQSPENVRRFYLKMTKKVNIISTVQFLSDLVLQISPGNET
jgi:hypothetical protein